MTRDPTRLREAMRRPPRPLEERLVRTYEEEIHPLWGQRFADLMLSGLPETVTGAVLEVGCATGGLTQELIARHEGKGRVVAVEAVPSLLDQARARCKGTPSTPVFMRGHDPTQKLPFAEETFDLVLAGPELWHVPDRRTALADVARVTAPGGEIVVAVPIAGTWQEPLDLLADVLTRRPRPEATAALASYRANLFDEAGLRAALGAAGVEEVQIETTRWQLLFPSGREFFYAPVIETGPLPDWRAIAAEGGDMLELFVAWKDAIDTYFANQAFAVSVLAARARGRRSQKHE